MSFFWCQKPREHPFGADIITAKRTKHGMIFWPPWLTLNVGVLTPDISFGTAARESMELMTSSPGVLYNVEGVFRNGPVKGKILPGFNLDTRKPLAENSKSSTAAIYSPKLTSKVS